MRSSYLALALTVVLFAPGCAAHTVRHAAAISVVTAHGVLGAVQDTEMAAVCGKSGAPAAPACVNADTHKKISEKLSQAFDYDIKVAETVKSLPPEQLSGSNVPDLLAKIAVIVDNVLDALPESLRSRLLAQIGVVK